MHQRQRRDTARILQVFVVDADLICQQQAFVDHSTCRHRRYKVFFAVQQFQRFNRMYCGFTDHIQLTFKRVGNHDVGAAANENLADHRFFGTYSRRHRHVAINRHITPAQHNLTFGADGAFDFLFTSQTGSNFFRQENHTDAIFTRWRQGHALFCHFFAVKLIRHLNQDTGTVTHQRVSTDRAAVVDVFQDLQTLFDDSVAFLAFDVGNKAHATGVMFIAGMVQTLRLHNVLQIPGIEHWNPA